MNRLKFLSAIGLIGLSPAKRLAAEQRQLNTNRQPSGKSWLVESFHTNINEVDVPEVDEWRHVWFGEERPSICLRQGIYDKYAKEPSLPYSWQIELVEENKPCVLVDYLESSVPFMAEENGAMDFHGWLAEFKPASWGDWLMVPVLHRVHLMTGSVGCDWGNRPSYREVASNPDVERDLFQFTGCEPDHVVSKFLHDRWVRGSGQLAIL